MEVKMCSSRDSCPHCFDPVVKSHGMDIEYACGTTGKCVSEPYIAKHADGTEKEVTLKRLKTDQSISCLKSEVHGLRLWKKCIHHAVKERQGEERFVLSFSFLNQYESGNQYDSGGQFESGGEVDAFCMAVAEAIERENVSLG